MRFECKQCGACCRPRWAGDYQTISFLNEDIEKVRRLIRDRLNDHDADPVLPIKDGSINTSRTACAFLSANNTCTIHEVKPACCRQWPWINLTRTRAGQEIAARRCPGIILEDDIEWKGQR